MFLVVQLQKGKHMGEVWVLPIRPVQPNRRNLAIKAKVLIYCINFQAAFWYGTGFLCAGGTNRSPHFKVGRSKSWKEMGGFS